MYFVHIYKRLILSLKEQIAFVLFICRNQREILLASIQQSLVSFNEILRIKKHH